MVDPRPWEPYENPFYDFTDDQLADAYVAYIDATNTRYFSEIFWEASRRGLSLDELEEIHESSHYDPLWEATRRELEPEEMAQIQAALQYDPPCSVDF